MSYLRKDQEGDPAAKFIYHIIKTKYTQDEKDKKAIEREIAELKMSLDLIN